MMPILRTILALHRLHIGSTMLSMLAIISAGAGLTAVLILNHAATTGFMRATQPLTASTSYQITAKGGSRLTKVDYAHLRKQGFTSLIPVLNITARLEHGSFRPVDVLAVDVLALLENAELISNTTTVPVDRTLLFKLLSREGGVLMQASAINEYDESTVDPVVLINNQRVAVTSVHQWPELGHYALADIALVQRILNTAELSSLWLLDSQEKNTHQQLGRALPAHLQLKKMPHHAHSEQMLRSFRYSTVAMSLLMFLVCMFIVSNALNLMYSARLADFKVMRQLGVPLRSLGTAMLAELTLLCLLLTPISIYLGTRLLTFLVPSVSQTLERLFDVPVTVGEISPALLITAIFLATLLGAWIAALLPIRQLKQMLHVRRLTVEPRSNQRLYLLMASIFLLSGACSYWLWTSLTGAFVTIALVLVVCCLSVLVLLPLVLSGLKKCGPSKWPLFHWGIADSHFIVSRSAIAFCAFFVAVTSNVAMNLMVDSFRQATFDWLEQRRVAELYVYAQDNKQLSVALRVLSAHARVLARTSAHARLSDGNKVVVHSYEDNEEMRAALKFQQSSPSAWAQFSAGKGIFINQQLFLKYRMTLGQPVHLIPDSGSPKSFKLVGVYYDYGNADLQVFLPPRQLEQMEPDITRLALFEPRSSPEAIQQVLDQNNIAAQVLDRQTLTHIARTTFDRTFVFTAALNWTTLLVAAFALGSSLYLLTLSNQPKYALLRSFGVSRVRIAIVNFMQYILLGSVTVLLAWPAGILLCELLIWQVNARAFYWTFPLLIDYRDTLVLLLISLATMLMIVMIPLIRQHNRPVSRELAWLE